MKNLTLLWICLLLAIPCSAEVIFVDADAPGANNGNSWADAYNCLRDALAAASSGDEVRVAEGIYKPDQGDGITPGDREATFQLINGVAIKGGYAGFGEPDPDARDINAYETILSGDLNGDDIDVNDPADLVDEPTRAENSYHVVTGSGTGANTVLDGFTITGGNANGEGYPVYQNYGAGMFNWGGSPMLNNCMFTGHAARRVGAGIYNNHGSPILINCTFSGNWAQEGGGMSNHADSTPTLLNCAFSGNTAGAYGGGMSNICTHSKLTNCTFSGNRSEPLGAGGGIYNHNSSSTLTNCRFSGSSARYGGAMFNSSSSVTLTNCTFIDNSAAYYGGGMRNRRSSPTVVNCTFSGNSANFYGGGLDNWEGSPRLTNCILWGNSPQQIAGTGGASVTYSDVQGGWPGEGNIDADPLFVDTANGDYHLLPTSPCVNAGDPNFIAEPDQTDIDGHPRVIDGRIDMGADEVVIAVMKFTPQALNPGSEGNWVKAHLVLHPGFTIEDVNTNSPATLVLGTPYGEPLGIESDHISVSVNEDGLVEVKIFFDRSAFCSAAADGLDRPTELTVVGVLTSGQYFYGTDTIRIITNKRRYLAILASHWLEGTCSQPDWCSGVDLDHSSTVDFVDFAMFDGCCIEVSAQ